MVRCKDFPGSLMGRDLTKVSCTFNGKPLLVMTAHLESEKNSSKERKAQFHQVRVRTPCTQGYTKYARVVPLVDLLPYSVVIASANRLRGLFKRMFRWFVLALGGF